MSQIIIKDYLKKYKDEHIYFIPNRGNAGDSLIAYATLQILDSLKIKYTIGSYEDSFTDKIILFGGGGSLVSPYQKSKRFLLNNHNKNKIVILPHTIYDDFISQMSRDTEIICRDTISYNYVLNHYKNIKNIFLADDLALSTNVPKSFLNRDMIKEANCFRTDNEQTDIRIPYNNKDYSILCRTGNNTSNRYNIKYCTYTFLNALSLFSKINTNRLHIAIAGLLLNKAVDLYPNSYFKNKAIYDYSLSKHSSIKFIDAK